MQYPEVVSTIALIVSVIAIPATYLIGVSVGKKNDKRKEFNALAEPVLAFFERRIREHGAGTFYNQYQVPFEVINSLRRRLTKRESLRFNKAFGAYIAIMNRFTAHHTNENPGPDEDETKSLCKEAERLSREICSILKLR
ncbi:hypothetical protein [Sodalis sp. RH22]|uniref:hypothetical protein n=1 Tax=unclassified Sodalis (in: enterobacteria) TaxID=2636512 RepID=UPI0039B58CEE